MKSQSIQLYKFFALVFLISMVAPKHSVGANPVEPENISREILVKLESGVAIQRGVAGLAELKVHEVRQLTGSMAGLGVYRLDKNANVGLVLKKLKNNPLVRYAQRNHAARNYAGRIPANAGSG